MSNINNNPVMQALVTGLAFLQTRKQAIEYTLHEGAPEEMPLLSYMVNPTPNLSVVTFTKDGKETENTAQVGDIIVSGVFGEMYVVKGAKFPKMYDLCADGKTVIPNQNPRTVAEIPANKLESDVHFTASWGEKMVLKNGDFLVMDGDNYYRIAREEFLETYVWA